MPRALILLLPIAARPTGREFPVASRFMKRVTHALLLLLQVLNGKDRIRNGFVQLDIGEDHFGVGVFFQFILHLDFGGKEPVADLQDALGGHHLEQFAAFGVHLLPQGDVTFLVDPEFPGEIVGIRLFGL